MILGIGTDIIAIERISKVIKKFPTASHKKILSPIELTKYFAINNQSRKIKFLATRWAVKEAFVKAVGTGFRQGLYLSQISVVNNELGQPKIILSENVQTILTKILKNSQVNIHVSLSDDDHYAIAYVILEKT